MTVTVEPAGLQAFYARCLGALGVSERTAAVAAEGVAYADLRGIDSHGAFNFERVYVRGIETGAIEPGAEPVLGPGDGPVALVDGQRAVGFASAHLAMTEAVGRARRWGVGVGAVRNSTHCGALGYYACLAADAGVVGLVSTNTGPEALLRAPGGRTPLMGTNPLAFAVPRTGRPQLCLDMSPAVVASSKVKLLARRGAQLPEGWLEDADGQPLRDAGALERGDGHLRFLGGDPTGGAFKGFGLAVLVDVLCGLLTGAGVGPLGHEEHGGDGIGHFCLALAPAWFGGAESFTARLDAMLGRFASTASYPGLPEATTMAERARDGVPLDEHTATRLNAVSERLGIPGPPVLVAW
jgi:LDH2 family malate/lactate/ureidoglycolate dehydrogenase